MCFVIRSVSCQVVAEVACKVWGRCPVGECRLRWPCLACAVRMLAMTQTSPLFHQVYPMYVYSGLSVCVWHRVPYGINRASGVTYLLRVHIYGSLLLLLLGGSGWKHSKEESQPSDLEKENRKEEKEPSQKPRRDVSSDGLEDDKW